MRRIGLIGEDPNDTLSIQNLLLQKHSKDFQFKQLLRNKKGHQLDNAKLRNSLKIEYNDYKPHYVIFIRDADALPSEKDKLNKIVRWFENLNIEVEHKGILLLNIYELEALILADIDTFNKLYKTSIKYTKNVMYQKAPKEYLMLKTANGKKKYSESDCPDIFNELDFDLVETNARCFRDFYDEFLTKNNLKRK